MPLPEVPSSTSITLLLILLLTTVFSDPAGRGLREPRHLLLLSAHSLVVWLGVWTDFRVDMLSVFTTFQTSIIPLLEI